MKHLTASLLAFAFSSLTLAHNPAPAPAEGGTVETPTELAAWLKPYEPVAQRIITATEAGTQVYEKLAYLCDEIGPRLSGSPALERAIEWAVKTAQRDGLDPVRAEPVMVPKWVRGRESLTLLSPRETDLPMLGLGGSIGTPPSGIEADVIGFESLDALKAAPDGAAKGKIVFFNYAMKPYDPERGSGYGSVVRYRHQGAQWAAEAGAVGVIIRSVTAGTNHEPHTGAMSYGDMPADQRIPAAAITIEAADMLWRMQERGSPIRVRLQMEARDEGEAPSANVVADLRGRELPDEVVIISGHYDSWDVGHGAHDDGGPCIAALEAAALLKRLNLIPRRTVRVVLWTNEENGIRGAKQYAIDHADDLAKHVAAIESDGGVFAPRGFSVQLADKDKQSRAVQRLAEILTLFRGLGATEARAGWSGADVGQLVDGGVPCMGFMVDGSKYFDYHHTHADTLDKIDREHLEQHVASLALMAYVLADMPGRLGDALGTE